jgi:hypothetical protein
VKGTPVFRVDKFLPPRCPNCERRFASTEDYGIWAGPAEARSFAEASAKQAAAFPELFSVRHEDGVISKGDRFHADFIACTHCENKTFRILYATAQVFTREEADRLVTEAGYSSISEGVAYGAAARRQTALSFLGQADLARLADSARNARSAVTGHEEGEAGDAFASLLDPAIADVTRRLEAEQTLEQAEKALVERFGELWGRLSPDCQRFLATGEVLLYELKRYSSLDPEIDFSPAVAAYSKGLELEIHERLFEPWRRRPQAQDLPLPTEEQSIDRSIEALRAYGQSRREMTLGDMGYCLRNVGCRLAGASPNGYASFLEERLQSRSGFCDQAQFPKRLQKYVMKYRNAAAHVERLTEDDCEGARAYLLEEPVELLLELARSTRKTDV